MVDLCDLNLLKCESHGKCVVNISSNTTFCQCAPCYGGVFCQNVVWRQGKYDTTYAYFIASIIGACFSLLNNGLVFELFICCRRIRFTNCGIYLCVYSIVSLLSSILVLTDQLVQYYPNSLINNSNSYGTFHCYVSKIIYNTLVYLCIWLSSCIAFERALFIWFNTKQYTYWRSYATIIVIFVIAVGSATPMLIYNCDWDNKPALGTLRIFFVWFYMIVGIATYVLITILVLVSFARRIHYYGMENGSRIKTFCKLLRSHLLIFVPPLAFTICQLPYTIVVNTKNPAYSYYQCGISLIEFIVKVTMDALTYTPYTLTWLLFVYPSRVYMLEYYLKTWSGQRLAKILLFLRSHYASKRNVVSSITNSTNNERDNSST